MEEGTIYIGKANFINDTELPYITICGTDFILDVVTMELRQRDNAENIISILKDMKDTGAGYEFTYSQERKNLPQYLDVADLPHVKVKLAEMVKLDPVGMSWKYGRSLKEVELGNDFNIMVDQQALQARLAGRLNTIDIAGHIFYIDLPMGMLRPHDDFASRGIRFSDIVGWYNQKEDAFVIPYNPVTHEFQGIDLSTITNIPKDLIVVEFPFERELDAVAWNRSIRNDELDGLKEFPIRPHIKAKIIDWKQTNIANMIKLNRKKQGPNWAKKNSIFPENNPNRGRRKGRKM